MQVLQILSKIKNTFSLMEQQQQQQVPRIQNLSNNFLIQTITITIKMWRLTLSTFHSLKKKKKKKKGETSFV